MKNKSIIVEKPNPVSHTHVNPGSQCRNLITNLFTSSSSQSQYLGKDRISSSQSQYLDQDRASSSQSQYLDQERILTPSFPWKGRSCLQPFPF